MAIVAMLGVVAGALAARMDWAWPEAARGGNRTTAMGATSASAAAATGTRGNGSAPLVPGGQFTIVGDVVDLASAAEPMTVIARVGDNIFPAAVQGNTYTVRVSGGPSTTMVKIEVESTRVHYESVLGTFGRLKALAGADARLVQAESSLVQVSSYTTALSLMTEYELGGRPAANDAEVELAMRGTSAEDMEAAAYLMVEATKGYFAPSSYANGYEMVKDREIFRQTMQLDYEFFEATWGFLSKRPPTAPVTALSELPTRMFFVGGQPAQAPPLGGKQAVFMLQKNSGNQVSFYEYWPMANTQYTASVAADGTVVLVPAVAPAHRAYSIEHGATVERRRTRYELRRLYKGDSYSHWAIKMFWSEQVVSSPNQPVVTGSWEYVMAGTDLERWSLPQGWGSNVANQVIAMPWLCIDAESNLNRCEVARHQFAANGTGTTLGFGMKFGTDLAMAGEGAPGPSFSWLINASARTLTTTQGSINTTYWRVNASHQGASTLVLLAQNQATGQAEVALDFMVPQPNASQWLSSAEGQWRRPDYSSAGKAWYYYYDGRFDIDRLGSLATYVKKPYYQRANAVPVDYLSYVQQGAVVDLRANVAGAPTTCDAIYPNTCKTLLTYFRPLLRAGNRYFGLQEEYELLGSSAATSTLTRTSSISTFHDCIGGPCTGATGLADSAAAQAVSSNGRSWVLDRAPVQQRAAFLPRKSVLR